MIFAPFGADSLRGYTLVEWDNLVVEADAEFNDLKGRRLLKIDDLPVIAEVTGPKPSDPTKPMPLICEDYPEGVVSDGMVKQFRQNSAEPKSPGHLQFQHREDGCRACAGAWPERSG